MKKKILIVFFLVIQLFLLSRRNTFAQATTIKVLDLRYFPIVNGRLDPTQTGMSDTLEAIRAKVDKISAETLTALDKGSKYHGYKDVSALPSLSYSIFDSKEYLTPIPKSDHQAWSNPAYRPDYFNILSDLDICNYVDNLGVKEVWIWGYHYGLIEPDESNMSMGLRSKAWWNHGTYGDVSNSQGIDDMPVCQNTYALFNYNYGEGTGNIMEDHMHQLENIFGYVDWNLFRKYVGVLGTPQQSYNCGDTHNPPNTIGDYPIHPYDWMNEKTVLSDCQNWNPQGTGKLESINCHSWAGVDCDQHHDGKTNSGGVAYKVWWMQNLPGRDNNLTYQERSLINWWDLISDFDGTISKTNKSFFSPSSLSPTPSPTPACIPNDLDINDDGVVNILEFEIWRREFTRSSLWKLSDFDCNGEVNIIDFEILRRGMTP